MIKIGDKVRTKPDAPTRYTGWVTAIHEHSDGVVVTVYLGGYQSVQLPLSALVTLPLTLPSREDDPSSRIWIGSRLT